LKTVRLILYGNELVQDRLRGYVQEVEESLAGRGAGRNLDLVRLLQVLPAQS